MIETILILSSSAILVTVLFINNRFPFSYRKIKQRIWHYWTIQQIEIKLKNQKNLTTNFQPQENYSKPKVLYNKKLEHVSGKK